MALLPKSIIDVDTIRAARGENQQRLANEATADGLAVLQRLVRSTVKLTGGIQTTILEDGRVLIPDGSVTEPGLAFLDDTDTGLIRVSQSAAVDVDYMAAVVEGEETVRFGNPNTSGSSASSFSVVADSRMNVVGGDISLSSVKGTLEGLGTTNPSIYGLLVDPDSLVSTGTLVSGNHPVIAAAAFYEPNIDLQSTAGVTNAATVYIKDAPTEGSNNDALLIGSGSVTLNADNQKLIFGAGRDATIAYDATNLVISPAVVGTGRVDINGGDLSVDATQKIYPDGGGDTYWHEPTGNVQSWVSGGVHVARMTSNEYTVNPDAADIDFRVSGDAAPRLLATDAASGVENIILLAGAAPNFQSMSRGIFIGNSDAIPTGNPTGGGFLYVEAGALKWRGSSGTVTTLGAA